MRAKDRIAMIRASREVAKPSPTQVSLSTWKGVQCILTNHEAHLRRVRSIVAHPTLGQAAQNRRLVLQKLGKAMLQVSNEIARDFKPTFANHDLGIPLSESQKEMMRRAVTTKVEELFDVLMIDHKNDHNTRDTPSRVARMFINEIMRGRYEAEPKITEFINCSRYNEIIITGPIELRSTCAHHLMPIYGDAIIGVLPAAEGKVIGLSKYDRIVDHFASRLQIQEELVMQIGDYIMDKTSPAGLAVRISAVHMCKCHRGVRSPNHSRMVSASYYGALKTDERLRSEFITQAVALETAAR